MTAATRARGLVLPTRRLGADVSVSGHAVRRHPFAAPTRGANREGGVAAPIARGFRVDTADAQLDSTQLRTACRFSKVSCGMSEGRRRSTKLWIVADVDVSDVAAVKGRLVRDGTDDISGLDAVRVADLDAIRFGAAGPSRHGHAESPSGAGPASLAVVALSLPGWSRGQSGGEIVAPRTGFGRQ